MATPTFLLPIWNGTQFFDNNGNVLAGGLIYQYEGGSYTVQQTTYQGTDVTTTPNPNPITLNADGRMPSQMWGQEGLYYNLQLTDSQGNIIDSEANIIGSQSSAVPGSSTVNNTVWNLSPTPGYISGTQFSIAGSYVANYAIGTRVQYINGTNQYGYGTVSAVSYTSGNTIVTLTDQTVTIGSNLTAVYYSILQPAAIGVDAGAVSYTSSLTYAATNTVGGQISNINTEIAVLQEASGVTPGTYNQANITVNTAGKITAASTGLVVTTKGDIEGFSTVPARIPVGANGTVLTANSANALGVQWQAPFNSNLANAATANLVRTNNNSADPALTVALAANIVYNFTINATFYAPSAGVFIGVGTTCSFVAGSGVWGGTYNNYESGGGFTQLFNLNTQTNVFTDGIDSITLITITGTIYTTSSGNLYLYWGNPDSGANNMTRYAGAGINAVQVS